MVRDRNLRAGVIPRIVLFVFAGRRPNIELQLPFIRRILEEHRNVEFDIWNLARDNGDSKYLQTIEGERITVRNEYRRASPGYDHVYRHYASDDYRETIFIKLDDDVVFLQTGRFLQFIRAIQAYPEAVISADVINNGACTPLHPDLYEKFENIGIPLLDVHKSAAYAGLAHNYFFNYHTELLNQRVELIPTEDWLSINTIGYNWLLGCDIARRVSTKCAPCNVAGRDLNWLGDEGIINTLPRIILRGFLTCHLTFGPQNLTTTQLMPWREHYAYLGEQYLATAKLDTNTRLPMKLSQPSHAQATGIAGPVPGWRERWTATAQDPNVNDPQVGRYKP